MKSRILRVYTTLIAVILIAIYAAMFFLCISPPLSGQACFFLLFIPIVIIINWASVFITASFRSIDSAIASGVSTLAVQCVYTAVAVILSIILALFSATMKVQIVMQVVVFGLYAIGMLVSFFSAANARSVAAGRADVSDSTFSTRSAFREVVDVMEAKGMKGDMLEELSRMRDSYCHAAPCNDPAAKALDIQISEELGRMRSCRPEEAEGSIDHLRFLVKRRTSLRSR